MSGSSVFVAIPFASLVKLKWVENSNLLRWREGAGGLSSSWGVCELSPPREKVLKSTISKSRNFGVDGLPLCLIIDCGLRRFLLRLDTGRTRMELAEAWQRKDEGNGKDFDLLEWNWTAGRDHFAVEDKERLRGADSSSACPFSLGRSRRIDRELDGVTTENVFFLRSDSLKKRSSPHPVLTCGGRFT